MCLNIEPPPWPSRLECVYAGTRGGAPNHDLRQSQGGCKGSARSIARFGDDGDLNCRRRRDAGQSAGTMATRRSRRDARLGPCPFSAERRRADYAARPRQGEPQRRLLRRGHPVWAQTITTSAEGLIAGEVKIPAGDADIPAYRAMPEGGGPFPTIARGPRDFRRPRAHQGRLPPLGQARLFRDRAGPVRAPGRRREGSGHRTS